MLVVLQRGVSIASETILTKARRESEVKNHTNSALVWTFRRTVAHSVQSGILYFPVGEIASALCSDAVKVFEKNLI